MDFISFNYYLFLIVVIVLYYVIPIKYRWYVLLVGSLSFYYWKVEGQWATLSVFLMVILLSYLGGLVIEKGKSLENLWLSRMILGFAVVLVFAPLFMVRMEKLMMRVPVKIIVPLGISFFTMQMVAYLADIYRGKIAAQKNILKYSLFISFFPQIIQGPIPRYEQLEPQLIEGHRFDERYFTKGLHLIIWGFFLKLMIADKAAVVVDMVFGKSSMYKGMYVLIAGILYSVQLYTDFMSCVMLAKGAALLFGIQLADNFQRPYLSESIKEFWGRWHISLSSWLRDYVYIPLGGNRRGRFRKYIHLILTFAVSGVWHGWGIKYVAWGLIHAVYQVFGDLTFSIREKLYGFLGFAENSAEKRFIRRVLTFLLVMLAWIIFRAGTLEEGIGMVSSIFTVYNPWILFNDAIFKLGLSWKEWVVLLISIGVLIKVSLAQEKGGVSDWILSKPLIVRWGIYIVAILVIFVYGTYGFGFKAQDFIYGGF